MKSCCVIEFIEFENQLPLNSITHQLHKLHKLYKLQIIEFI